MVCYYMPCLEENSFHHLLPHISKAVGIYSFFYHQENLSLETVFEYSSGFFLPPLDGFASLKEGDGVG